MEDSELGANQTCFVISPIGNRLAPAGTPARMSYENSIQLWENVFEPAAHQFGLRPIRSDKIAETGEITEQIFRLLKDADVVIADLTGGNANVMYELGVRHTRNKVTLQLGEFERLPFDVNTIRTIQFRRTEAGLIDARNALTDMLRNSLQGKGAAVAVTRIWQEGTAIDPETVAEASALSLQPDNDSEAEESGLLEMLVEGEAALPRLGEILERVREIVTQLGKESNKAVESISRSDKNGSGFAGRLTVAKELADVLKIPARELDELGAEYVENVSNFDALVQYAIGAAEENTAQLDESREFLNQLQDLASSAESVSPSIATLRHSAKEWSKLSKVLAPLSRTLSRALSQILSGNTTITGWHEQIENLPGWRDEDGDGA